MDLVSVFKKIGAWNSKQSIKQVIEQEEQKINSNDDSIKAVITKSFSNIGQISAARAQIFKTKDKLVADSKTFQHIGDSIIQLLQPIQIYYSDYSKLASVQKLQTNNKFFFNVLESLEGFALQELFSIEDVQTLAVLFEQVQQIQQKSDSDVQFQLDHMGKLYVSLKRELFAYAGISETVDLQLELDLEAFVENETISERIEEFADEMNYFEKKNLLSKISSPAHLPCLEKLNAFETEAENLSVFIIKLNQEFLGQLLKICENNGMCLEIQEFENFGEFLKNYQQIEFIKSVSSRSLISTQTMVFEELVYSQFFEAESTSAIRISYFHNYSTLITFERCIALSSVETVLSLYQDYINELCIVFDLIFVLVSEKNNEDSENMIHLLIRIVLSEIHKMFFYNKQAFSLSTLHLQLFEKIFVHRNSLINYISSSCKDECASIFDSLQSFIYIEVADNSLNILKASTLKYFATNTVFELDELNELQCMSEVKEELSLFQAIQNLDLREVIYYTIEFLAEIFKYFHYVEGSVFEVEVKTCFCDIFKVICDSIAFHLINSNNWNCFIKYSALEFLVSMNDSIMPLNVEYDKLLLDLEHIENCLMPAAAMSYEKLFCLDIDTEEYSVNHDFKSLIEILQNISHNNSDEEYFYLDFFLKNIKLPYSSEEELYSEFRCKSRSLLKIPTESLLFKTNQKLQDTFKKCFQYFVNESLVSLVKIVNEFLIELPEYVSLKNNNSISTFQELDECLEFYIQTKSLFLGISNNYQAVILTSDYEESDADVIEKYLNLEGIGDIICESNKLYMLFIDIKDKSIVTSALKACIFSEFELFHHNNPLNETEIYFFIIAFLLFYQLFEEENIDKCTVPSIFPQGFVIYEESKSFSFDWNEIDCDIIVGVVNLIAKIMKSMCPRIQ